MNDMRAPKAYDFKGGTLYVQVHAAELSLQGPWRDQQVEAKPALLISSNPECRYRSPESVKIRGREYRVHTGRTPVGAHERRDGRVTAWTAHSGLSYRAYLNDNDVPVSWDTATARQLDAMVDEACDRFAADFPEWQELSIRLAVESLRDRAESEASTLRESLAKVTAKRDRLAAALELDVVTADTVNPSDLDRR